MENNPQNFMTMTSVYDFHNLMLTNKLIMIYDGEFNQDITKTVLAMTEKTFDADGVDEAVKKKVFNVMVESLQNICKHQYHASLDNTTSIFMIGDDDKDFMVISGNPIVNDNIDNVKGKIDHVNTLDKEGLKAFYKESRLKSTISNVGGAGLGFIDMARKSGKKLEYSFEKINDTLSFFTLLVRVSKFEIAE